MMRVSFIEEISLPPLLCKQVVEAALEPLIYRPCISKRVISYFAKRLTLKSTQSISVAVIYLGSLAWDQTHSCHLLHVLQPKGKLIEFTALFETDPRFLQSISR